MSNSRFSILQAVAVKDKRISDAQFRTLAALGMYADKNGWCYPSLKTLGADLSKSKQAVGRDTIALRKLGYLEVKNRYDSKTHSRHSNLYRLKFDLPDVPDVNVGDSTLSTSEVDVNDPINDTKEREIEFKAIAHELATLQRGGLKPTDADLIQDWLKTHKTEWILKAIQITKDKGSQSSNYADRILIGWEANGYPKTREQRLAEAKGKDKPAPTFEQALAQAGYQ